MSDLNYPLVPNSGQADVPIIRYRDQGDGTQAVPVVVVSGGGGGGTGYSITDLILQDSTGAQGIRRETAGPTGTVTFLYENFDGTAWVPTPPMVAVAIAPGAGSATSAKQDTGNTSLASIDTKTPTVGQKTSAASSPVVLASDQPAIPVTGSFANAPASDATTTGTISVQNANPSTGAATANSTLAVNTNGCSVVNVAITANTLGSAVSPQGSTNGTDWVAITQSSNINSGTYTTSGTGTIASGTTGQIQFNVTGFKQFRFSANSAVTGTLSATLNATAAGAPFMTNVNLTSIGGSVSASTNQLAVMRQPGGLTSTAALGTFSVSGATLADYAAQAWATASGNGASITDAAGAVCSFDINLTTFVAGSSVGLDIFLQWSPDGGTTWYDLWQCEALTAAGHIYIPALYMPSGIRRMRWVNRGGAATTATVSATATRLAIAPASVQRQWFDRTAAVLAGTPISSATAVYDVGGCKIVTATVVIATKAGTLDAVYQLQTSADGTNWSNAGSPTVTLVMGGNDISISNNTKRFARVIVSTAATGTAQVGTYVGITGSN